jgi:hypothetical protein
VTDVDRLLHDDRTQADVIPARKLDRTRTSYDEAVVRSAALKDHARFLLDDASEIHERRLAVQLDARTAEVGKRSVREMLSELAALGFAWRDIARLVGVTVPALRKWRNGEMTTGRNRLEVARLLAFVNVLQSEHLIQEIASWMEMPIGSSTLTGLDVYGMGHVLPLLLHGTDHMIAAELLRRADPGGEHRPDDRFEVITASDGQPAIRMRQTEPPG